MARLVVFQLRMMRPINFERIPCFAVAQQNCLDVHCSFSLSDMSLTLL